MKAIKCSSRSKRDTNTVQSTFKIGTIKIIVNSIFSDEIKLTDALYERAKRQINKQIV